MIRLIINGDDFGMNERCSRAIAQAMGDGLITHTTMMANGAYFAEAVALAREHGFTDRVGIHFNLTEGAPLTQAIRACDAFVRNGIFHKGTLRELRPLDVAEQEAIRQELTAQVGRLTEAGIRATFADSHHYVHNLLNLAPIVAQVCRAHGVRRIRLNRTFSAPDRPRITEGRIGNAYWREQDFVTCEHFGRLSDVTAQPIPDHTEIMVHPDYDRDGVLIDRIGILDGYPVGEGLRRLTTV